MKIKVMKLLNFLFMLGFFFRCTTVFAEADLDTDPSLSLLQSILENTFNIVVIAVGGVLVAVVAYGIWKSSLSLGDPRGLEGAKQTWTYALYGFMVIILFFVVFTIVTGFFGVSSLGNPKNILGEVFKAINELIGIPPHYSTNTTP